MSNTNKSLSIGQVIYVLSNVKQKIVPAVVVEEIVVKKLDGNHVSWKVSVGPPGKERIVDSNRLDGDIYGSLDEIRDVLFKRLSSFLNDLVKEAEKRVELWYGQQVSTSKLDDLDGTTDSSSQVERNDKIAPENLISEFESHATMSSRSPQMGAKQDTPASSPPPQKNQLQNKLRQMIDPDLDASSTSNGNNVLDSEEIELPDGRKVRLNIKG